MGNLLHIVVASALSLAALNSYAGQSGTARSTDKSEAAASFAAAQPTSSPVSQTLAAPREVWAISIDNDLFVPGRSDKDYTAGFSVSYNGLPGVKYWQALDSSLQAIDSLAGPGNWETGATTYTPQIEFGVYGFTPEDIERQDVIEDDRPYASLVYLASSRVYETGTDGHSWSTSLTVGFLGLDVFETGQNLVHDAIGSRKARGWSHQISDGGEPTFRYSLAYHQRLGEALPDQQAKLTYYASAGYLTETGVALTLRQGLISSPDNRFNPELTSYGERVNELGVDPESGQESYFWGGAALKYRIYNAFVEGQFRHSDHTLDRGRLEPLLLEAWVGYTQSFSRSIKLSYVVRAQTSEVKSGTGDRSLLWGGFIFSQTI